ncbi:MAG: 6-phosphofructokinase [Oscillospiraceae bacterium]|nr:6-phosphofructokinase [Oscillospiraceae bacterium]
MSKEIKTIGVLTSGGDAPGMNAAIRSVVRTAISKGFRVMGIERGYNGLIHDEVREMNVRSVSEIIHRGGTVLYTARCLEFMQLEGQQKAAETCRKYGIDAVVSIGGDGSFRGARDLSKQGIPCIGLPGTIDNDIACSEYTIGYDTAMNTAVEMIDKLRDTTQSHDRCSVVEVMGRHAGYLAINVGIATGALITLIPEEPWDLQKDVIDRMMDTRGTGKKHFIILVAEGVGHVQELAATIQKITGIESRATVLGHVQRGGSPTLRDRVVASEMGYRAIELLEQGIFNRVIGMKGERLVDYDIDEALAMHKEIDELLPTIAKTISI